MSHKGLHIEKEVNYNIKNKDELLSFLHSHCNNTGLQIISFQYFVPPEQEKDGTYARIEHHHNTNQIFLTVKSPITHDQEIKVRKEITIPLPDSETGKELLLLFHYIFINQKIKHRQHYTFEELSIDVDSWYTKDNVFIESRIEIEGENNKKIREFVELVREFIDI